ILIHIAMTEPSGKRQEPLELKEELKFVSLEFRHNAPHDFFRSQWQSGPKSWLFLFYRWILALIFGIGLGCYLILYFRRGTIFIYLTAWCFVLCSLTSFIGALFVTVYHIDIETMVKLVWIIKFYWVCYWTNLTLAYVVAFLYWSSMFLEQPEFDFIWTMFDVWVHGLPVVLFSVDHMLVAQPARLLHFMYPFCFTLVYLAFSVIYNKLGGLDSLGKSYIYIILNYENPTLVLLTIVGTALLIIVFSTMLYGLYIIRTYLARRLNKL
ncbi:hypothetical protein KR093_008832, partial [Drosophila rubida]